MHNQLLSPPAARQPSGAPRHRTFKRPGREGRWVFFSASLLLIFCSTFMLAGPPEADAGWPLPVAVACLGWFAVYFFCMLKAFGTPYLFTTAYLLVLSVFHLGIIVPLAFGWQETSEWQYGNLVPWLNEGAWYTALALGCFGAGAALSLGTSEIKPIEPRQAAVNAHRAFQAGIGLFLASVVFFLMFVQAAGNPLNYSRADFFHSAVGGRGLGAFMFVFPGAIVLMAVFAQTKGQKLVAWTIAAAGFLVLLISGYRNAAFSPLLAGAVLWVKTGKRIPPVVAALSIAATVLLISTIAYLRAAGTYGSLDREDVESAIGRAGVDRTFAELGGTAAVLAEIVRLVQTEEDYRLGRTYWTAIVNSVPNVTASMQESSRRAAMSERLTDPDAVKKLSPSEWLTFEIAKEKFEVGEGVGFSAIGEPLLNFGPVGVVVFFLLLGFLLGRLDQASLLASPRLLIFAGALFWALLRTARNDIGIFVKTAVFVLVVLAIWRAITWVFPLGHPGRR